MKIIQNRQRAVSLLMNRTPDAEVNKRSLFEIMMDNKIIITYLRKFLEKKITSACNPPDIKRSKQQHL